jgi:hypothetical protein
MSLLNMVIKYKNIYKNNARVFPKFSKIYKNCRIFKKKIFQKNLDIIFFFLFYVFYIFFFYKYFGVLIARARALFINHSTIPIIYHFLYYFGLKMSIFASYDVQIYKLY